MLQPAVNCPEVYKLTLKSVLCAERRGLGDTANLYQQLADLGIVMPSGFDIGQNGFNSKGIKTMSSPVVELGIGDNLTTASGGYNKELGRFNAFMTSLPTATSGDPKQSPYEPFVIGINTPKTTHFHNAITTNPNTQIPATTAIFRTNCEQGNNRTVEAVTVITSTKEGSQVRSTGLLKESEKNGKQCSLGFSAGNSKDPKSAGKVFEDPDVKDLINSAYKHFGLKKKDS